MTRLEVMGFQGMETTGAMTSDGELLGANGDDVTISWLHGDSWPTNQAHDFDDGLSFYRLAHLKLQAA